MGIYCKNWQWRLNTQSSCMHQSFFVKLQWQQSWNKLLNKKTPNSTDTYENLELPQRNLQTSPRTAFPYCPLLKLASWPKGAKFSAKLIAPRCLSPNPCCHLPLTAKVSLKYLTFGSTPEPAATRSGRSSAFGRRRETKAGVGLLGRQQADSTAARVRFWGRQPAELGFTAADAAGPAQKVAAMLPYLSPSTPLSGKYQKKKKNE